MSFPLLLLGRKPGRRAAFSPDDLSGLFAFPMIAAARSAGKLWQDAGKTTPATAAGDPVRVVVCPFTAVEFTAPADANRAVLGNSGAAWWLVMDGAATEYAFSGPAPAPLSLHAAVRGSSYTSNSNGNVITGPTNSQRLNFDAQLRGAKEGVAAWNSGATNLVNGTDYVGALDYGATGDARYYLDGVDDGQAIADVAAQSLSGNLATIGSGDFNQYFVGRLYGWGIYTAKQGAAGAAQVATYMQHYF